MRREPQKEYAVITTKRSFRLIAKDARAAVNRIQTWCDQQDDPKPTIVDVQQIGEY